MWIPPRSGFVVDGDELEHLEATLPGWRRRRDVVPFFLADERPAYWGGHGDQPALGAGVLWHHEFEDDFLAVLAQGQARAEAGPLGRNPVEVHQLNPRHTRAQHRNPALDEALPLL